MFKPDDRVLSGYRLWLLKMSTVLAPGQPDLWQDLAQEGHVAMWRALRTYDSTKGALPSWLTTAARMRMTDVLRRGTWLGTHGARGHVREKPATPVDPSEDWVVSLIGGATELLDIVLTRYHDGEIAEAINSLTHEQREYIVRRFWHGQTEAEIQATFKQNVRVVWWKARDQLRSKLGHLARS